MNSHTEINQSLEIATLGGGCFWCLEAAFELIRGIDRVESGYTGGAKSNPSYSEVCRGTTGHAEVVQLTFNPQEIGYSEILDLFFVLHDPTTLNRQGHDVGTQYRSAIFFHDEVQKRIAVEKIAQLNAAHLWSTPIVTEITPYSQFWKAEEYHQGYYRANPGQGYCQAIVAPKVAKVRSKFAARLK